MTAAEKMSSQDIRDALHGRWPDNQYIHIDEAPINSDRGGRKLDVLVVSLWRSRHYQLEGIEIKVSMADFRTEMKDSTKADWWWHHVHRFWIAAPAEIAKKIKPELPPTWGLLSVSGNGVRALVTPEIRTPEPIPWETRRAGQAFRLSQRRTRLFRVVTTIWWHG